MSKYFSLGVVAGAALAGVVGLLVAADIPSTERAPEIGRYQIAHANDSAVWLVDTASGHVWWRAYGAGWEDQGSPVKPR